MAVKIKQIIRLKAKARKSNAKYKIKYSYKNLLSGTSKKQTKKYSYTKKVVAKKKYSYKRG